MPPVAAATAVSEVVLDLFLVLLAAKAGDELFKRLSQPAIVGEILAGVMIGPSVFGIVEPGEVLAVFAELGVVFLLFWVGLETRLSEMRAVGPVAARVGVAGVIGPFIVGYLIGQALGEPTETKMFLGAALVATSVGITSAVLLDLKALVTAPARVILGAAVIDDVLAMIILAIAAGLAEKGSVDLVSVSLVTGVAVAFIAFFAVGGTRLLARSPRLFYAPQFSDSPLLPAVILCLGLAALAAQIGLAAIIGAFLAGMIVAETKEQGPIGDEVAPLYAFFPPFFFVFIGLSVDLGALASGETLLLLAVVTLLAAASKFVGAWLGARGIGRREALTVGLGMIPRGEVGIIVASIGAAAGVVDEQLFAVIVGMSILTTLMVPPLLRRTLLPDQRGISG